jgi:hypothetical protein
MIYEPVNGLMRINFKNRLLKALGLPKSQEKGINAKAF